MAVRQGMRVVVRLGVLALALGIAAGTTAADIIRQASGGFYVGEVRRGADGDYRKLIASFSGWTVWETAVQAELICLAIKAGNGRLSPVLDAAFGFVTGDGGGFFSARCLAKRSPPPPFTASTPSSRPPGERSAVWCPARCQSRRRALGRAGRASLRSPAARTVLTKMRCAGTRAR